VNLARGFLFSGLHAGIKPARKDLALIHSPTPCSAAAVVTQNKAKAAPCADLEKRLPASGIHSVLINSGVANALTGPEGLADVAAFCAQAAKELNVEPAAVVMASTGVIGMRLPKEKISAALPKLVQTLKAAPETAAEAILTTDTRIKMASRVVKLGGKTVTLTAIAKGSGMIAPQLATLIGVFTTDAAISPAMLQKALADSMDGSFHNLTVDNDMSTNDVVLALANGLAGNAPIVDPGADWAVFQAALFDLCKELAREVASDGEGATKLLEVTIAGAPTRAIATDCAKAIAGSSLVKAAMFGADPNWGRVLATVGARAGSQQWDLDPSKAKVSIQGIGVYDGRPTLEDPQRLRARMREPEVKIAVDLRQGDAASNAWGCDFSYDYVKLNADYTSLLVAAPDGSVQRDDRLTNYSPHFKVSLLTQALSYISRFADKRCVVKLGRAALAKDSSKQALCEDINLLRSVGLVPIVVHGEGPESDATLERLGQFGTDTEGFRVREMVLNGSTNSELVAMLNRNGGHAVGVSGKDGALLRAGPNDGSAPPGFGILHKVDGGFLRMLLSKGYVPVISPVGIGEDGASLPLDADRVAAEIAVALNAAKLVYLTGKPGIVEKDELLAQLTSTTLEERLSKGVLDPHVDRKARCILRALAGGVDRVHVIDARSPHSIIAELFTDQGVGTLVTRG
jgi:acetylglutamate kinase